MSVALQKAGLKPESIDYINLHGTGTENSDLSESIAMKRLFTQNVPPFNSTKAYAGHTLGAAGAFESVFSKCHSHFENQSQMPNPKRLAPVYINGMGAVTPQNTRDPAVFLGGIEFQEERFLHIQKPNFKDYIPPAKLRRMSKIVRMGILAAKMALSKAQSVEPDAILTGTGMGCQIDTEKFLNLLLNNKESYSTSPLLYNLLPERTIRLVLTNFVLLLRFTISRWN